MKWTSRAIKFSVKAAYDLNLLYFSPVSLIFLPFLVRFCFSVSYFLLRFFLFFIELWIFGFRVRTIWSCTNLIKVAWITWCMEHANNTECDCLPHISLQMAHCIFWSILNSCSQTMQLQSVSLCLVGLLFPLFLHSISVSMVLILFFFHPRSAYWRSPLGSFFFHSLISSIMT